MFIFKPIRFYSPDDGEGVSAVEEAEYISPRDMFLNDLMSAEGEVGSQYEEQPVEAQQVTENTEIQPDLVGEAVVAANQIEPETQNNITMDDLNKMKEDIIGQMRNAQPHSPEMIEPAPVQPEAPNYDDSTFTDKFYADPKTAIDELIRARANDIVREKMAGIQPLLDQAKAVEYRENVRGIINDFVGRTSDARQFLPQMTEYIQQNGLAVDDPHSYQDAYNASKIASQNAELESLRANQGLTLDDYLNDSASVDSIVSNQQIRDRIINDYLKSIQNGGRPVTITSNGTSQTPAQSAFAPKTFDEAARLFVNDLNR